MPNIIVKKTFKVKPSGVEGAAENSFSLHGAAVTPDLVKTLNAALAQVRTLGSARTISFQRGISNVHYSAGMNRDYQEYNEEDAMCAILDTLETLGWTFRFQYDNKVSGSSITSRELFIFNKQEPDDKEEPVMKQGIHLCLTPQKRKDSNHSAQHRCRICQRKTSYFCSHCTGTNGQSSWICNATTRRSCFEQHLSASH